MDLSERRELREAASVENLLSTRRAHSNKRKSKQIVSDQKLCSGLVRRVRGLDDADMDAIFADLDGKLFVERYLEEIADGLVKSDARKVKDVFKCVRIAMAMHARYEDFANFLLTSLVDSFKSALKDKNFSKVKLILRLTSELVACGVCMENDEDFEDDDEVFHSEIVVKMLKKSVGDFKPNQPLPNSAALGMQAVACFCRGVASELSGRHDGPRNEFLNEKLTIRVNKILENLCASAMVRLSKERVSLRNAHFRLLDDAAMRGSKGDAKRELLKERRDAFDALTKATDEVFKIVRSSERLPSEKFSELDAEDDAARNAEQQQKGIELYKSRASHEADVDDPIVWAYGGDYETMVFYCDVPDLTDMLPLGVLANGEGVSAELRREARVKLEQKLQAERLAAEEEAKNATKVSVSDLERNREASTTTTLKQRGSLGSALDQFGKSSEEGPEIRKSAQPSGKKKLVAKDKQLFADAPLTHEQIAKKAELKAKKKREAAAREAEIAAAEAAAEAAASQPPAKKTNVEDQRPSSPIDPDDPFKTHSKSDAKEAPLSLPVQELFKRLPTVMSAKKVDAWAVDFCLLQTNKIRNRLVLELFDTSRRDSPLCPFYARLVAVLSKIYPDVGPKLLKHLDGEFRWLQKRISKTETISTALRNRNVRFLGELVKFHLQTPTVDVPPSAAFSRFDTMLSSFHGPNVETMCVLMETCGRVLYRTPHTHDRLNDALGALSRQRTARRLWPQEEATIDNALYYVKPPENRGMNKRVPKARTMVEKFLRFVLKRGFVEQCVEGFNALDLEGEYSVLVPEGAEPRRELGINVAVRALIATRKANHVILAPVVASLRSERLRVAVLASLSHNIDLHMTSSDPRDARIRLAEIKQFASLIACGLFSIDAIFDMAYRILNLGHCTDSDVACDESNSNKFHPSVATESDPDYDGFRLKMWCVFMTQASSGLFPVLNFLKKRGEGVVDYLQNGDMPEEFVLTQEEVKSRVLRLRRLLAFLDRYVAAKTYLPLEAEYEVVDLLELLETGRVRTKPISGEPLNFRRNLNSLLAAEEALAGGADQSEGDVFVEQQDDDDEKFSLYESSDDDDDDEDSEEESEDSDSSYASSSSDYSSDGVPKTYEDELLEKEFEQMMNDASGASSNADARTRAHNAEAMSVPTHLLHKPSSTTAKPKFQLLKKNAKGKMRVVDVALNETTQAALSTTKNVDVEEAELLKSLVLDYASNAT